MAWSMASHAVWHSRSRTWKPLLSLAGLKVDLFLGRVSKVTFAFSEPRRSWVTRSGSWGTCNSTKRSITVCIFKLSHQRISQQPICQSRWGISESGKGAWSLIMSLQQCHVQVSLFNLDLMLYHVWLSSPSRSLLPLVVHYEYMDLLVIIKHHHIAFTGDF